MPEPLVAIEWKGEFSGTEVNQLHAEAFNTRVFTNDESPWNRLTTECSWGWVVARSDDGVLTGFVNVVSDGLTHAWVQDVMVSVATQRQHIGVRMINEVRDRATAASYEWLHVDFDDEHTAFYIDACGFTPAKAGLMELG